MYNLPNYGVASVSSMVNDCRCEPHILPLVVAVQSFPGEGGNVNIKKGGDARREF